MEKFIVENWRNRVRRIIEHERNEFANFLNKIKFKPKIRNDDINNVAKMVDSRKIENHQSKRKIVDGINLSR